LVLDADDPDYPTEVDAEIVGGVTMAFCVITPAILLAYAIEGREAVMRTSLDALFCLAGAVLLIAAGGKNKLILKNRHNNIDKTY
jgi:hypothetical protein